jgi:hypothetical protein
MNVKERWGARKPPQKRASILTIADEGIETPRADEYRYSLVEARTEADVVDEISKLWSDAQRAFLTIGRLLVRAEQVFRGSFERDVVSQLPFNRNVAHMLRTVAEKVAQGVVAENQLPRSYAAAFRLVTLEPDALEQARKEGLIAPETPRSAIEKFRQDLRTRRIASNGPQAILMAKRSELTIKLERMVNVLGRLRRELAEIDNQIRANVDDNSEAVISGPAV